MIFSLNLPPLMNQICSLLQLKIIRSIMKLTVSLKINQSLSKSWFGNQWKFVAVLLSHHDMKNYCFMLCSLCKSFFKNWIKSLYSITYILKSQSNTLLLVEKAGVAPDVTLGFIAREQVSVQARESPWLWNPWGGSHEVQNRSNQWPKKMDLGATKNF